MAAWDKHCFTVTFTEPRMYMRGFFYLWIGVPINPARSFSRCGLAAVNIAARPRRLNIGGGEILMEHVLHRARLRRSGGISYNP
jgi:hypothetical protein